MNGGSAASGGGGGHEKWEESGYILMGEPAGLNSRGCEKKKRVREDLGFWLGQLGWLSVSFFRDIEDTKFCFRHAIVRMSNELLDMWA